MCLTFPTFWTGGFDVHLAVPPVLLQMSGLSTEYNYHVNDKSCV